MWLNMWAVVHLHLLQGLDRKMLRLLQQPEAMKHLANSTTRPKTYPFTSAHRRSFDFRVAPWSCTSTSQQLGLYRLNYIAHTCWIKRVTSNTFDDAECIIDSRRSWRGRRTLSCFVGLSLYYVAPVPETTYEHIGRMQMKSLLDLMILTLDAFAEFFGSHLFGAPLNSQLCSGWFAVYTVLTV